MGTVGEMKANVSVLYNKQGYWEGHSSFLPRASSHNEIAVTILK